MLIETNLGDLVIDLKARGHHICQGYALVGLTPGLGTVGQIAFWLIYGRLLLETLLQN